MSDAHSKCPIRFHQVEPGLTFGNWTVIGPSRAWKNGHVTRWFCRCRCGNVRELYDSTVRRGGTNESAHCGCIPRRCVAIGQTFGRLTVVAVPGRSKGERKAAICRCACGRTKRVVIFTVLNGDIQSCGCLWRDTMAAVHTTHGKRDTPEYNCWASMKGRCLDPGNRAYRNYGGRGITVCARWRASFEAFLEDMGGRPDGTELDRINNDGPYSPQNCRWATPTQQCRNKRDTIFLECNGERKPLVEWAEQAGVSPDLVRRRHRSGCPFERLFGPSRNRKRKARAH